MSGWEVNFFVAQIAAIVIYQSANLIIAQLFSPEKVTEYNIAYRYFSIPHMLLMIILVPMWSAYTDAYSRQDTVWMLNTIKKLRHTFVLMLILSTIMLFVSSFVYRIWIGNVVTIPFEYSLCIYLYTVLYMWVSTHIYVINGIGKVHLLYMFSMAEIILFVPLSVLLGRTFGVCGVISSMIVFVLIRSIWSPIQVNKLIRGNARGVWNL